MFTFDYSTHISTIILFKTALSMCMCAYALRVNAIHYGLVIKIFVSTLL